ncbi:hypothetical protein PJK45_15205 [Mycobacterium kansasii]|uniref:Uncharacterized protein n=3 Tax=Mycobacterium kansasii TaxID=1768 RepID=A0A1V3WIU2_MYCKA|nr:hypothetical protein [Mycobacterium kansasii]ETZ98103.1 hypothetical protein I547_6613 [Mycobacterium kansasii 824]AGZ54531.1 hypothetical protein MKAN_27905 [Mycobacterium kansasii ATCC 12478]ARG54714.1 hypothetical protein B1T43_01270 [Mycobacterium kansasii]ARG60166.1 hypothetical protein B1T45_01275 [Mycobacterium kansasii]ARG67904.1 hypothetical protein B1T47_01370 [Mycobacterium kansasii]
MHRPIQPDSQISTGLTSRSGNAGDTAADAELRIGPQRSAHRLSAVVSRVSKGWLAGARAA